MIALITERQVVIFRRTTAGLEWCWTINGDRETLERGLDAARRISELARDAGDWSKPGRFGLDAFEPIPPTRVRPRVLRKDVLDRGLRKLKVTRS